MMGTLDMEKIGMDVPVQECYPTFMERYFTPRYVTNLHSKGDDICVFFHSNRACLITLALSHPIIAESKKVVKIDFDASESEEDQSHLRPKHRNQQTNRLANKVSGKRKKGAQILFKMSLLCKVECEDGSVYAIRSGIPGVLVEINEHLIENPNLLSEKPSSDGYIAIVLPKTLESDRLRDRLLTPEQYKEALEGGSQEIQETIKEEVKDEASKEVSVKMETNSNASQDQTEEYGNGSALLSGNQQAVKVEKENAIKEEPLETN